MSRLLMWPVWWGGILCAILFGGAWGLLPAAVDWFDTVDADDYLVSTGGYAGAAVVLLLAAAALEGFDGPRNARRLAVLFAGLYSFLSLRAAVVLDGIGVGVAEGWEPLWDGLAGSVATPWAVFFLTAGAWGWVRVARDNRAADTTTLAGA